MRKCSYSLSLNEVISVRCTATHGWIWVMSQVAFIRNKFLLDLSSRQNQWSCTVWLREPTTTKKRNTNTDLVQGNDFQMIKFLMLLIAHKSYKKCEFFGVNHFDVIRFHTQIHCFFRSLSLFLSKQSYS